MVCIIWSCTFQHGPFGVGWWGGFYSHSVYTRPLARLEPAHWCFIYFKRCIPNNLAFRRKTLGLHYVIEGSPFSSCCPTFKALKLSTTFMIVLLMFSERGIKRFWKTCWIYPRELASFIPSNIFGGSLLLFPDCLIITRSSGGVFFGTFVPCSSLSLGFFLKFSEGLLRGCEWIPGKSAPFLLFPSSHDEYGVYGILPFSPMGFFF